MRKNTKFWQALIFIVFVGVGSPVILAQELDLGEIGWKIWLDTEAEWKKDSLFLPGEFRLEELPQHAPTCGWDEVYSLGQSATLPAVVEEFYSGGGCHMDLLWCELVHHRSECST